MLQQTTNRYTTCTNAWKSACRTSGVFASVPAGKTFFLSGGDFVGPCNGRTIFRIDGTLVASNNPKLDNLDYWITFDGISRLTSMIPLVREYTDGTKDYVNIQLDNQRNKLIQLQLTLPSASFAIAVEIGVAGIFGMNIPYTWDHTDGVFWLAVAVMTAVSVVPFLVVLGYARWKKLLGSGEARLVLNEGCRLRIGDGSQIHVFGEKWTNDLKPITAADTSQSNVFLHVSDLIDSTSKSWKIDVIQTLSSSPVTESILRTHLYHFVAEDMRVWEPDKSGLYSVRSAYKLLMNRVLHTDHLQVTRRNWSALWKLKISPKVKHFLWRLCRGILPVRPNLIHRHINAAADYPWCTGVAETEKHLFISCPKAAACWNILGIGHLVNIFGANSSTFADYFFSVLAGFNTDSKLGSALFSDWSKARGIGCLDDPSSSSCHGLNDEMWSKPSSGSVKCNIDASFSLTDNRVGIGLCIRDHLGNFIRAKTHWFTPLTAVLMGESMGLHLAINWVRELGLKDVIFEMDAKMVVDAFNSSKVVISEFGCLISSCKTLFSFFSNNSHVEFTWRNANKVAHSLAREALFLASPQEYYDILHPSCITDLIINEMH
ncbi:hypothetical protein OROHE_008572 [Orobanche hederae]